MVNYTWAITKLNTRPSVNGLTNVVSEAYWILTGAKDYNGTTYTANISGITSFGDPNPSDFISYDQITFENMVEWLELTIGQETLNTLKNDVDMSIETVIQQILNPTFVNLPLPWENQSI